MLYNLFYRLYGGLNRRYSVESIRYDAIQPENPITIRNRVGKEAARDRAVNSQKEQRKYFEQTIRVDYGSDRAEYKERVTTNREYENEYELVASVQTN